MNEFESAKKWTYSGEADLIVLDSDIGYDDCVVFNIGKMIKDEVVDQAGELFESLIRYASDARRPQPG